MDTEQRTRPIDHVVAANGASEPRVRIPARPEHLIRFEMIPAAMIHVDEVYQRNLNPARLAAIVEDFDWEVFHALTVSRREDRTVWAMDGQHRLRGIRELDGDDSGRPLPCLVYHGLTQADEARIFYKMNRHRLTPSAGDAFKARLVFGDGPALAIKAICDRHGVVLSFWGSGKNLPDNGCIAIASLEAIYRVGRLEAVLGVLSRAWPGEHGRYKQEWLRALDAFLARFAPQFNPIEDPANAARRTDRLVDVLAGLGPVNLAQDIAELRAQLTDARFAGPTIASLTIYRAYQKKAQGKVRLSGSFDPGVSTEGDGDAS